ncbi:MAG: hypothetical protein AAF211_02775 [Myxococcota bacterium]
MLWWLLAACCAPLEIESGVDVHAPGPIASTGTRTFLPGPKAAVTSKQCEQLADGGAVSGPDCLSGVLACDQVMVGHTLGGVENYDSRFYEKSFCTPFTTNHDGGDERVYRLDLPDGEWRYEIWLDTPCADLSLFAFPGRDIDSCPQPGSITRKCEASVKSGAAREKIDIVHQGAAVPWFVVVEGPDDEEGAFALHVTCAPGVQ